MKPAPLLVVVSDDADRLPDDPAILQLGATEYLTGSAAAQRTGARVLNLCRDASYLSLGYYVSLIADGRGQHAEPSIDTLVRLRDESVVQRALLEAGVPLADGEPETTEALVLGGQAIEARFRTIGRRVHAALPHPLLGVRLGRGPRGWRVLGVRALTVPELDAEARARLVAHLGGRREPARRSATAFSLGVLFEESDPRKPSQRETIDRLIRVGQRHGVLVEPLGLGDLARVAEHDALWIRSLTGVGEPAFAFAQRAASLGMPVIDDPRSILRCSNKVHLHELLTRAGVATPPTLLATRETTYEEVVETLGSPFVVKLPDGSFSQGVDKIRDPAEWAQATARWFAMSPLLVVQAWRPTAFDWRVAVLDGRPLFVAHYHMAKGHWQIAKNTGRSLRYGKTEAVPRATADPEVVALACTAASLVGDGLYGVDLKRTDDGVVVIEINDNPNFDSGYEDAADGDAIYEDILRWFSTRVVRASQPLREIERRSDRRPLRLPITARTVEPPYEAYEVVGLEIEYPIVDDRLEPVALVAETLREVAGRPTSEAELGVVALSNEIVDHLLELKTAVPLPSLVETERVLAEAVRRLSLLLAERGARLLPTAMHPWMDPRATRIWTRSGRRVYATYARLFDVGTHGWANVQATHVNLPLGSEDDAVAMMNAAAALVPYLPALAASSPMHDGVLQPSVDSRLAFIIEHQARIPESCGDIVPETIRSLAGYRRDILGPMYAAIDRLPDAGVLRREYFNARGAVFKFSRSSMEIRVLDTQECVKMDVAIAAFVRHGLRWLAERGVAPSPHGERVADFHACVAQGSSAPVVASHLLPAPGTARDALAVVLAGARSRCPAEEHHYLDLVEGVLRGGTLSERMAAFLRPHAGDPDALARATRRLYEELCDCLLENRPWHGRDLSPSS